MNQCDGCQRGLPVEGGMHRSEGEGPFSCTASRYADLPVSTRLMFLYTKARAKKKGISFTLTQEQFASIVGARCSVTDILFETDKSGPHARRPFAPSIDRKDNTRGYELDNVRIVCVAANVAMNEWGEKVLYKMAYGIMGKLGGNFNSWRMAVDRLPEGVKFSGVGRKGPRYSARLRVDPQQERLHLGTFDSVEDAVTAIEAAKLSHRYLSDTSPEHPNHR